MTRLPLAVTLLLAALLLGNPQAARSAEPVDPSVKFVSDVVLSTSNHQVDKTLRLIQGNLEQAKYLFDALLKSYPQMKPEQQKLVLLYLAGTARALETLHEPQYVERLRQAGLATEGPPIRAAAGGVAEEARPSDGPSTHDSPATPEAPTGRSSNRIAAPLVESSTPGFPPEGLQGKWSGMNGIGLWVKADNWSNRKEWHASMRYHVFRFLPGKRYQMTYLLDIQMHSGRTKATGEEVGSYQFDGNILTLQPESYRLESNILGTSRTQSGSNLPSRRYSVSSAVFKDVGRQPRHNNGIVLDGEAAEHFGDGDNGKHLQLRLQSE